MADTEYTFTLTSNMKEKFYQLLIKEPELKARQDVAEQMAFNLGEAGVTVDSSRNASAEVLGRIKKAAVDNMVPLLGHSLALDRILEHLTTGKSIHLHSASIVAQLIVVCFNCDLWWTTDAGPAAAAHHANDRRHDPGQSLTNNTHRQFVADMADRFGDDAKRGVSHFISDENRKQVELILDLELAIASMFWIFKG